MAFFHIHHLFEKNNSSTLEDYIKWSKENAPAENYILELVNHGGGFDLDAMGITYNANYKDSAFDKVTGWSKWMDINEFSNKMLPYLFSTGQNRWKDHLEVLKAEGDAHDGDAEQQPEHQVKHGNLPPAQQDPDDVHDNRQAVGLIGAVHQFMAERPEGVSPQFEQLHAKRNTDDGDAHHQTDDEVDDGNQDAAKDEPENVAECFHISQTYEKLSILPTHHFRQVSTKSAFGAIILDTCHPNRPYLTITRGRCPFLLRRMVFYCTPILLRRDRQGCGSLPRHARPDRASPNP